MSPAKVNALRALEEAAEAVGWRVEVRLGDATLSLPAQSGVAEDLDIYIDGGVLYVGDNEMPVELMALLLEAAL